MSSGRISMTASALRQRRSRARKRNGELVVSAIVKPAAIETLIEVGRLPAWSADDRAAIARAIEGLLDDLETVTFTQM